MIGYAYKVKKTKTSFQVTIPGFGEWVDASSNKEQVPVKAQELLQFAIGEKFRRKELIPVPIYDKGEDLLWVPYSLYLKIELHNNLLGQGVSRQELANRLGMKVAQVTRMLSMRHTVTNIDVLEQCFKALGRSLEIILD